MLPAKVLRKRRKTPKFVRQESWRYVRLETGYRRPRGKDSRMRLQKSGSPPLAKIGYGSPKKYRGL
ncbi:MAG: eL32 family ribosomal protein, partial [Candidatus Caldarchaeum sp.]